MHFTNHFPFNAIPSSSFEQPTYSGQSVDKLSGRWANLFCFAFLAGPCTSRLSCADPYLLLILLYAVIRWRSDFDCRGKKTSDVEKVHIFMYGMVPPNLPLLRWYAAHPLLAGHCSVEPLHRVPTAAGTTQGYRIGRQGQGSSGGPAHSRLVRRTQDGSIPGMPSSGDREQHE